MSLYLANDKEFIHKLTEIVISNLSNESFGVDKLVEESGLNLSLIRQKLKSIRGKTISQFINEIRLAKALEFLQHENATASEVAYKTGFGSPTYFNKCFHEFYGFPPGEARKRFLNGIESNSSVPDTHHIDAKPFKQFKSKQKIVLFTFSGILILAILGFLIYQAYFNDSANKFPGRKSHEKSIAVLPFINDSPDSSNVYLLNGMMNSILDNLSKIQNLRVVSRGSAEQYRNNITKSITQIARELNVNYIIEGSGQKVGDQIKLTIQLIDAKTDKHLISKTYEREEKNIFSLQSEIAFDVAKEIEAELTDEEIDLIKKSPTTNLAAMKMYEMGLELHTAATIKRDNEIDKKAEYFFRRAIELDSTFSLPYVQLAWLHWSENKDTALYLANRALQFDNREPGANLLKGSILADKGLYNEAEDICNTVIKNNQNFSVAYRFAGMIYYKAGKFPETINYLLKATKLETISISTRNNFKQLGLHLYNLDFFDEGLIYAQKIIDNFNDSTLFYFGLAGKSLLQKDFNSAFKQAMKIDYLNENWTLDFGVVEICLYQNNYTGALKHIENYMEQIYQNDLKPTPKISFGFAFIKNGMTKEADWHFNKLIEKNLKIIENNQPASSAKANLLLTAVYSAKGNKNKALNYLRKTMGYKDLIISPTWIFELKNHPVYDTIRSEPEFQEFVKDMEAKFKVERVKIEKILREEGL